MFKIIKRFFIKVKEFGVIGSGSTINLKEIINEAVISKDNGFKFTMIDGKGDLVPLDRNIANLKNNKEKLNKFIQYIGTPEEINQAIKKLVSNDTKLIDLTGDKELENLFTLYSCFNPLKENIKTSLKFIKNDKAKKYIINDCNVLNSSDIEPLIDLYKENDITVLLFSNFEALNLKISSCKRCVSQNEPLPYYDYSFSFRSKR